MPARPYVLLSCATSIDGYLDDASDTRLLLSNTEDFRRVREERSRCDAILVGANTIRADNPSLLAPAEPGPAKVTLTNSGDIDPGAKFFTTGRTAKIVYAATAAAAGLQARLAGVAEVTDAGESVSLPALLDDLAGRGIRRLMVEGGGAVHTQFLTAGLADELQLAIAPVFVGDSAAPRFTHDGSYPWHAAHRARLASVTQVGDVALLRYALSVRFTQ